MEETNEFTLLDSQDETRTECEIAGVALLSSPAYLWRNSVQGRNTDTSAVFHA